MSTSPTKLKDYLLFVATEIPDENVLPVVEKRNLNFFTSIYGSTTGSKYEIIQLVCKQHNITPKQIVFIGDSNRDLKAAQKGKTQFIGMKGELNDFENDPEVKYVLDDLTTLPETIEEIRKNSEED